MCIVFASHSASASPDHYAKVQVSFKRTITETSVSQRVGDPCNVTETGKLSFAQAIALASDSYPVADDGNEAQLDWPRSAFGSRGRAITGSGTWTFELDDKKTGCQHDDHTVMTATADLDVAHTHFGFEDTRKTATGNVAIAGQWKPATGNSPSATAQGNMIALSMGQLGVYTAAALQRMGPGAKALEQAMVMTAQDAPVTIGATKTGFEIGYTQTQTIPYEKINPSTKSEKHSGQRVVTTEVKISIGLLP